MKTPLDSPDSTESGLAVRLAEASPIEATGLLNGLPPSFFSSTTLTWRAIAHLLKATQGAVQTIVLTMLVSRSWESFRTANVAHHVFLAHQIGRRGDEAGVTQLCHTWEAAGLSDSAQQSLMAVLCSSAWGHRNGAALEEALKRCPEQRARPDRLRLALRTARETDDIDWACRWAPGVPWQARAEAVWELLGRAWPTIAVEHPLQSPTLAVSAARRLLADLAWEKPDVRAGISVLFNAPSSPLRTLLDHEYALHPRLRLEALDACTGLTDEWEARGVALTWGSAALGQAAERQRQRLGASAAA